MKKLNIIKKPNLNKIYFYNFILAVLSTLGIVSFLRIESMGANSFVNIIYIFLTYIIFSNLNYTNKTNIFIRNKIIIALAIFLSTILIIGNQLDLFSEIIWGINTIFKIICLSVFIYILLLNLINNLYKINLNNKTALFSSDKLKRKLFIIILLLIFFAFLALYPGIYAYDSGFQIVQFLHKDYNITAHFSIPYSFTLSFFVNLGNLVFESYTIGFALFIILQIVFISYVCSEICYYIYVKLKSELLLICSILFYSFFPFHLLMTISAAQDTLYAGIFGLIILKILLVIEEPVEFFKSKKNVYSILLLMLLLVFLRNNGVYVLIFAVPFILLFVKVEYKYKILKIMLIPILIYFIYSGPILSFFTINKGNSIKEMSSIPSQQIARIYNYNQNILSKKEKEKIKKLYSNSDLKTYTYRQSISDSIKADLDTELLKSEIFEYSKLYFSLALRDPENYVEAFLLNTLGFWYPNKIYPDERIYHPIIEYKSSVRDYNSDYVNIKQTSYFQSYNNFFEKIVNNYYWTKIPIISFMFNLGTYFVLTLISFCFTLILKKHLLIIPFSFIIGQYITMFLSPVAIFRYGYPIILISPLLIYFLLYDKKSIERF